MTATTMRAVAFQPWLISKRLQRAMRVDELVASEPGAGRREDKAHVRVAFGEPFEVVGLAMRLDPSDPAEHPLKANQYLRSDSSDAVLRDGNAKSIPIRTALSRVRVLQAKAALAIKKSGGPGSLQTIRLDLASAWSGVSDMRSSAASKGPAAQTARLVLLANGAHRASCLRALDLAQVRPQQRDSLLRFRESTRSPHVGAVRARRRDLAKTEHGALKPEQGEWDTRAARLRHADIERQVSVLFSTLVRDGAAFAIEEPRGPRELEWIQPTKKAAIIQANTPGRPSSVRKMIERVFYVVKR